VTRKHTHTNLEEALAGVDDEVFDAGALRNHPHKCLQRLVRVILRWRVCVCVRVCVHVCAHVCMRALDSWFTEANEFQPPPLPVCFTEAIKLQLPPLPVCFTEQTSSNLHPYLCVSQK
jgi:hypothetical protein